MSASTSVMELIVHASGVGGGMSGDRVSRAIRAIRAEAWDEAIEEARARLLMGSMDEEELRIANPYREEDA